jgi:hypothetical protein
MFDLEQAIAEWRRKMAANGLKAGAVLDELESHLREDVERKVKLGSGLEPAFQKAVADLGNGARLEREFAIVREFERTRTRHVLRRWPAIMGMGFGYSAVVASWFIGVRQGRLEATWREVALTVGAMIAMIVLGWAGNLLAKYLPVSPPRVSLAAAFGVIILYAASLRLFWSVITPANLVHTQIILLWSLSPMPGIGNCLSVWSDNCKHRELANSH